MKQHNEFDLCGRCIHCISEGPAYNTWDCTLAQDPTWDEAWECWDCDDFKDAEEVWERARERYEEEMVQRGKDEAKGIYE